MSYTGTNDIKCRIVEEELKTFWPQWHVEKRLGAGAFGDVFQIYKDYCGIRVYSALKVIQVSGAMDAGQNSAGTEGAGEEGTIPDVFMNEIWIMEALRGAPSIVSIDDFYFQRGADANSLYVRMELLTSFQNLMNTRYKNNTPFTIKEVLKIGKDICTALMYCEQRGIIHRDIKPANLFVDSFGNYKVGDFGASKRMESVHATHTMTGIGTISYMAPEIFAGRSYNNTVDIYAVGMVLYQILNNGRMPFLPSNGAYTPQEIDSANYRRLHGEKVPSLAGMQAGDGTIDDILDAIICKACSSDSYERYSSAKEFYDALDEYVKGERIPAETLNTVFRSQNSDEKASMAHILNGAVNDKPEEEHVEKNLTPEKRSRIKQGKAGTVFCPQCGASISEEALFCPFCGNRIVRSSLNRWRRSESEQLQDIYNRADAYETAGDYQTALKTLLKYNDKENSNAEFHNRLGLAYRRCKMHKEALECFNKAIEIDAGYANPYSNIADIYRIKKDYNKAVSFSQKAVDLVEKDPDSVVEADVIFANHGIFLGTTGQKDKAEEYIKKAEDHGYKNGDKARKKAGLMDAPPQEKAGLMDAPPQEVKGTNSEQLQYIYDWATSYENAGDYRTALEILFQYKDSGEYSAEFHNRLGLAYYKCGMYQNALECYYKAAAISPNYAIVYSNISVVYSMLRDYNSAVSFSGNAVDLVEGNYDNPPADILVLIYSNHGVLLGMTGQKDKAEEYIRKAEAYGYRDGGAAREMAGLKNS